MSSMWRIRIGLGMAAIGLSAGLAEAKPWIMRHGQNAQQYQDYFDNELPAGFRPISVNVNGTTANPRFTTVFVSDGVAPGDWAARHGLDSDDYQAETVALDDLGFRVIAVDAVGDFPNETYVAAYVRDGVSDADWYARHRLTDTDVQNEFNLAQANNFRMIYLSGYGSGANRRYAAAFVRNFEGISWTAAWGMDTAGYQTTFNSLCRGGFRQTGTTVYGTDANPTFAGVWERPDGPNFELQRRQHIRAGLTGQEYQDLATGFENTPWQSTCAVEYGTPGNERYAVCWEEDRGPSFWTENGQLVPELAALDQVMQDFMTTRKVPHGSLAVTYQGKLVYSRSFTYAPADEPISTPKSLFRIASISKPITAIGVFQLIEDGIIDPNATLGSFNFFDVNNWCDPQARNIRVSDLLRHLGGWDRAWQTGDPNGITQLCGAGTGTQRSYFDPMFNNYATAAELGGVGLPVSQLNLMNYMQRWPLNFAPGTAYEYSNFGYMLLGRVIEEATGQSYEDYIRDNVLCPVGSQGMILGKSLWEDRQEHEIEYSDPMRRCSNSTFATDANNPEQVAIQYGGYNIENMDAHGGWVGSASHLVRIVNAFTDPNSSPLLDKATIQRMWTPTALSGGGYAAGWQVGSADRYHNGSLDGAWTFMSRRNDGICWAVVLNQKSSDANTPVQNNDWDIRTNIQSALTAMPPTPSAWPRHNLFGVAGRFDLDCSGGIDLSDLAGFLPSYGAAVGTAHYDPAIDVDGDGVIGLTDLAGILSHFGEQLLE